MAAKSKQSDSSPISDELADIKRLLILLLVKMGASQEELASALQLDRSRVSRMIPARKIEKLTFCKS